LRILRFTQDAKSIFLANMSHEIRTPLNAILGYADILQRKPDLKSDVLSAVSIIENSGEHLLALINDILDLSKIEVGRMELQNADFDLTALIDTLSTMFRMRCEQKGLAWRVEWQEGREGKEMGGTEGKEGREGKEDGTAFHASRFTFHASRILVHGDEGKLRQVLLNLLSNAVKFTDYGEVILRISTSHSPTHPLTHPLFLFEVIDTGVGIPPQDREMIFEPFQQGQEGAAKGGTGLGLTIAKRQIELMGGKLDFESPFSLSLSPPPRPSPSTGREKGRVGVGCEGGVGTRFFFTLPFEPAKEMPSLPAEAKRTVVHLAEGYQVKALVADDVQETRDVLSKFLSDIGVEVITAENGQQALEMVRSHQPDIVFMDIRMPVMDGIEATQRILTEFGRDKLKIVAVSASALAHEQKRYLEIGFDAFIAKPFLTERIYDCLAYLLHVEYEYEDAGARYALPLDFSKINLPYELLRRLKAAAEIYSTTELKSCLNEVSQLGEDGNRLAEHLHRYLNNYDMEAILKVLSEIKSLSD